MDEHPNQARSFGGVADAYERGRPTYPPEAALWLTSDRPLSVLELGAGTGKLTAQLVALGHQVHATDPDPAMLAVLQDKLPDVAVSQASAEEIPSADAAYDVVVAAQCFHWFDVDQALPEISRVLKPHGRFSAVWNQRDERIPWVRRLGAIIGSQEHLADVTGPVAASRLFDEVEAEEFRFWQVVDRDSIRDLVQSRSNVAVLDQAGQQAKLAEVLAFYDEYGRGMDGMQLPYTARCFRTTALDRVTTNLTSTGSLADGIGGSDHPGRSDGSSTDLLLIDFK